MKRFTALVAALLLAVITYAQPIVTSVGNLTVCTDTFSVPVEVVKIANVGAISLVLEYDNTVINYIGYQNGNPSLSVGYSTVVNQVGNKVFFSWHSVAPLNILQGTLVEYVFTSTGGTSYLNWDVATQAACEYSNVSAMVLASTYVNGSVTVVPDPAITGNPVDVEIEEGQNASFSVTSTNATAYQWEVSMDNGATWMNVTNTLPYIGANQSTLQIIGTDVMYNQYQYRCIASGMCLPSAVSSAAVLTVNPIITTTIGTHTLCADEIIIPVNVTHFYGVAGISLTLGYNSVVLQYAGIHSSNPLLSGANLFVNSTLGRIYISWYSLVPTDIGDDLLLELAFTSTTPGTSAFAWDLQLADNCQYNNIQSDIISSVFVDGEVTVLPTPAVYTMTGGGEYCAGDPGVVLGLSNSQNGVSYDLYLDGSTLVGTYNGTGSALNFGYQTAVGTYTVFATNNLTACDKDMSGSKTVGVNPVPVADAGADELMLVGTSANLYGSATGGTGSYIYEWMPGAYTSSGINVSPATTTNYTFKVTDSKGCFDMDDVTVTVYMNTVNGQLTYKNNQNTPIVGATVYIQDIGVKTLMTDVTDANGEYSFTGLANGTYNVWASHNGTWGGVNSTDALVIMEHFILLHPMVDPLNILASDVDASGYINATDAFQVANRFVQNITSFNSGDWVFEDKEVTLYLDNFKTVDLKGLCYGDANGSYIPSAKSNKQVSINQAGSINVNGKNTIEIPVNTTSDITVGAISLTMEIPSNLNIVSVLAGDEKAIFSQNGNVLNISWYNTSSLNLTKGASILRIIANIEGAVNGSFNIMDGEIADDIANTMSDVQLTAPKLSSIGNELQLSNYPNPFRSTTNIQYSIPASGNVAISVYNLLGEKVAELVNAYQESGQYSTSFDANSLLPGIYQYKMDLDGVSTTRTMIRIK